MEENVQDPAEIRAILFGCYIRCFLKKKYPRKLYPSWSNGNEEGVSHSSNLQRVYFNEDNHQCKDNKIQKDPVTGPQNNITEMFCKLVKEQSAPQVDLEPFDGNPLEYKYFMSMFKESVEKKIEDPRGRLTRFSILEERPKI